VPQCDNPDLTIEGLFDEVKRDDSYARLEVQTSQRPDAIRYTTAFMTGVPECRSPTVPRSVLRL